MVADGPGPGAPRRVCVVGAGAIGGLVATRLLAAGETVSLLARGPSVGAIRARGLELIEPTGGTLRARPAAVSDDPAELGAQDVVVVAVKAQQLGDVAPAVARLLGKASVVLPLQNGIPWWFFQKFPGPHQGHRLESLDPAGILERHLPTDRVIGMIAYPAAEREAPGVIRLVEGDRFPLGELDGERSPRARQIAEMFTGAGFKSRVVADIRAQIWIKALGNVAMNPISTLTRATLDEITGFEPTRALATQMMAEASAVADELGLRVRMSVEKRLAGIDEVGAHKTSMLQDLEAGRPLEIEPIIGSVVEIGRLTGTAMPATEAVYALVSLLERHRAAGR